MGNHHQSNCSLERVEEREPEDDESWRCCLCLGLNLEGTFAHDYITNARPYFECRCLELE